MRKLLTADDVAAMLGMSRVWVYQHASGLRQPKLQALRIGRSLRFTRESVEALLAQREKPEPREPRRAVAVSRWSV